MQQIASAAALKRASSSRWQSCWQCCCQSSRTKLPVLNRRRFRATPCSLCDPVCARFPAAASCIGPAASVVAPQKMIRLLCTEEDCVIGDQSSMGAERCPTSRFASVIPAAAAPGAASIALRSNGRHRLLPLYVMLPRVKLSIPSDEPLVLLLLLLQL